MENLTEVWMLMSWDRSEDEPDGQVFRSQELAHQQMFDIIAKTAKELEGTETENYADLRDQMLKYIELRDIHEAYNSWADYQQYMHCPKYMKVWKLPLFGEPQVEH